MSDDPRTLALYEGSTGWRAGIKASIRRLRVQAAKPRDLWHPAYFAAIDEAIVHLETMLSRGTERATSELMETADAG